MEQMPTGEENKDRDTEAIQALVEERARQEKREVSDADIAFFTKQIKGLRQQGQGDIADKIVNTALEAHEVKLEMGPGLYALYEQAQEDVADSFEDELARERDEIMTRDIPEAEKAAAMKEYMDTSILKLTAGVRKDERIVEAFKGREYLLEKALKLMEEKFIVGF